MRAPRELTRLDGLAWAAGLSEPAVPFDGAAVASLLARAVIGAVVLELLLRGAVLPALARLIGAWPAIAATAVIGAISFGALAGDGALLLPALALGLLLGPLLVATGSIVPGAALSAGFAGAALALACGWGAAGARRPRSHAPRSRPRRCWPPPGRCRAAAASACRRHAPARSPPRAARAPPSTWACCWWSP